MQLRTIQKKICRKIVFLFHLSYFVFRRLSCELYYRIGSFISSNGNCGGEKEICMRINANERR